MNIDQDSPKFKNYNLLPRRFNKMLFCGEISLDEFAILLIYVMCADWDNRHKVYSTISISNNFLSKKIIGLSRNKVAELKKTLLEKGFIKLLESKNGLDTVKIEKFNDFQPKIDWNMKRIEKEIDEENNKQY